MTHKMNESKGHGSISVSNVGSKKSECITLTYTLKDNLQSLENINRIVEEMDEKHNEQSKVTVTISNYGSDEQDFGAKYQVKSCGNEALARTIKDQLDQYVQKQGGQTTLDEQGV